MVPATVVNDPRTGAWLAERVHGFRPTAADIHSIAWERGGKLAAAVLYRNHAGQDVEVIAAADGLKTLFSPQILKDGFEYPFLHLGCRRVTAYVASNNARSRRFVERLGFKHEGTIRQGVSEDTDLLVYGILRRECAHV